MKRSLMRKVSTQLMALVALAVLSTAVALAQELGVGKRIVNFTRTVLGFLPGGLGIVTVASCLMFGGVSGSALADTAAIGKRWATAASQLTRAMLNDSG